MLRLIDFIHPLKNYFSFYRRANWNQMSNVQIFTFHFEICLGFQYFFNSFQSLAKSNPTTMQNNIYENVSLHSIIGFIEYSFVVLHSLKFTDKRAIEIKREMIWMNQSQNCLMKFWQKSNHFLVIDGMHHKKVLCMFRLKHSDLCSGKHCETCV